MSDNIYWSSILSTKLLQTIAKENYHMKLIIILFIFFFFSRRHMSLAMGLRPHKGVEIQSFHIFEDLHIFKFVDA